MGRILVDLPATTMHELGEIAEAKKIARAELINRAVVAYIAQQGSAVKHLMPVPSESYLEDSSFQDCLKLTRRDHFI